LREGQDIKREFGEVPVKKEELVEEDDLQYARRIVMDG
jgi:hypothetical protein